ncbi:MAG: CRTAC1 family protein [Planctomycetaceae bacterium]|nr:CRTAC1 family protein [Planctomycetaceae bacterium]
MAPLASQKPGPRVLGCLTLLVIALAPGGCDSTNDVPGNNVVPGVATTDATRNCGPGNWTGPDATATARGFFTDITDASGLDFHRVIGPLGTYFLPEINGSGGAMFDYDGDGDLDIYLVNSGRSPKAVGPLPAPSRIENRLFRQEEDGRFTDATAESGLGDKGYGIGCAIGDANNDGHADVFVTNYGRDRLYLNDGQGHFRDVTEAAGLATDGWATSATFCDYDRDGHLDLFLTQYGAEAFDGHMRACDYGGDHVGYCSPLEFNASADVLLHNEGPGPDGVVRFRDVTSEAGLAETRGTGFCVVCADFDRDGWTDFYVANDMYPNRLWINQKDGTFIDRGLQSGSAYNFLGRGEASMGLALGDVDADGDWDLLSTHFTDETNTLYINDRGEFRDATEQWQLGLASRRHTGWGVSFVDLDHDGFLDIPLVNGLALPCHWRSSDADRQGDIIEVDKLLQQGKDKVDDPVAFWKEYGDRNQIFLNTGKNIFVERTMDAGDFSREPNSGRALICGDIDNDGDIDLLVTTTGGRARLYRNDLPKRGHWLKLRAIDPAHHRDAYGAELVVVAGNFRHHRILNPAGSYLASHDPRIHVGLDRPHYDRIEVRWPDGDSAWETFPGGPADRQLSLRRGTGTSGSRE